MQEYGSHTKPEVDQTGGEVGKRESRAFVSDQRPPSEKKEPAASGDKLLLDEERETGSVSWGVYGSYLRSAFSYPGLAFVVAVLLLDQAAQVASTLWLGFWSAGRFPQWGQGEYMAIYAAIGVSVGLLEVSVASDHLRISRCSSGTGVIGVHNGPWGASRFLQHVPCGLDLSHAQSDELARSDPSESVSSFKTCLLKGPDWPDH